MSTYFLALAIAMAFFCGAELGRRDYAWAAWSACMCVLDALIGWGLLLR